MKVIEISQKTHLIRHWFKWYRVQRGGTDWQSLVVEARKIPTSTDKILNSFKRQFPLTTPDPSILDVKAADAAVAKVLKKHKQPKS